MRGERDTVEAWSRGAEPFLLVDRFETCLGREFRWSRRTNGPREKGAAPVTRIFRGSPINGSFLFLSPNRLNFFARLQEEGLSYILKQRAEGRVFREAETEEGEGASGTKGFKKHFSKSFFEATRGKRRGTHVARSSSKRRRRSSCGVKRIS